MKKTIVFISILLLVLFFTKATFAANPIDDLKPGEWYEVPNSELAYSGVLPNPLPPGYNAPAAIMQEWSGGTYDSTRNRLIILGGGHGGYGGNEIYAFDINTLKWSRVWGPSSDIPPVGGSCSETYSDGNPASRHTYDGLVYLPTQDKFWSSGGSLYCGSGGGSSGTWMFNFATFAWERKANALGSQVAALSDYDSNTGLIYGIVQSGELGAYNPGTNTWTSRGNSLGWAEFDPARTLVYHTTSKKLLLIGGGSVISFDMTQQQPSPQTISTTGGNAIVSIQGPGLAYDPTIDKIVGWSGAGSDVYSLDLITRIWTKYTTTNSAVPPSSTSRGTYGRWQYIPSKNVYIAVNSIYNNVFFYKLSSGTPPPTDTTPPTTPTNLQATFISSSQINLAWTASTDNVGVAGYRVYRCQGTACTPTTQVGTSTTNSYQDTGLTVSTAYRYSLSAYDAAGNEGTKSAIVGATTQPSTQTGQINISLDIWVARPLPSSNAPSENIKDFRMTYNPDNKLIYVFGGDYSGTSGRTEMYSYSVEKDEWKIVHGICLSAGQEQPGRPDEGTFVYDTKRKFLWWIPGFSHSGNPDNCQSNFGYFTTMSFNPSTITWTSANYIEPPEYGGEKGIYGQYDKTSDRIIRLLGVNEVPKSQIYDLSSNSWSVKTFNGMPTPSGQSAIGTSMTAMDDASRKIYAVDPFYDVLWEYDITTETLIKKANVPFDISQYSTEWEGQFNMRLYWDSANKILLFPQINGNEGIIRFHTYKPSTNVWEVQKTIITRPAGLTLRGNGGVYNPDQNVLVILGGSGTPNPYLFLYRYGDASSLKGDVNHDNQVDILDIQALVNHILGTQNYGSSADVNSDGSVNILDVQALVNIILGG